MSKVKKFEYQPTYKYSNQVEEFVYAVSHQLRNYLNDLSTQIPENCYELHTIIYDLLMMKGLLLPLKSPYFHDSNVPIAYDEDISYEIMCMLHMKANDLTHMIDRVILKITEQYFIHSSNEVLNKRIKSKPDNKNIYRMLAEKEIAKWEDITCALILRRNQI